MRTFTEIWKTFYRPFSKSRRYYSLTNDFIQEYRLTETYNETCRNNKVIQDLLPHILNWFSSELSNRQQANNDSPHEYIKTNRLFKDIIGDTNSQDSIKS